MFKFKRFISLLVTLVLIIMLMPTNTMAIQNYTNDMTPELMAKIVTETIGSTPANTIKLYNGTLINEYSFENNKDSLFSTVLPNDIILYEYYDKYNEKVYSSKIKNCNLSGSALETDIIQNGIDITDINSLRKKATTSINISDEQLDQINSITNNAKGDLKVIQSELDKVGLGYMKPQPINGSVFIGMDVNTYLLASAKQVNPAGSVYSYAPTYNYSLQGSSSKYHSGLAKTIYMRAYEFRNNYVQTSQSVKSVNAGITVVVAAATCLTITNAFSAILAAAGVYLVGSSLGENIAFLSEQYVSFNGEKSGWTYDYVTPNAPGRYNGYVKTYKNSNTGKITMVWDGNSSQRYNFRWAFSVHPAAYDVPTTTILDGAYNMYTSAIMVYGYWPY